MFALPQQVRKVWPGEDRLQRQMARFPRPLRKRVRKAASQHAYLADLAFSFPMALFAIASNARGHEATTRAIALVSSGARLNAVADALALPAWLRKVPPEALIEHVPHLPDDATFTRVLVNLMPRDQKLVGPWLQAVDVAANAHSRDLALWTGKNLQKGGAPKRANGVAILAVYAWYSGRPALEARKWITKPWRDNLPLADAISAADSWLTRLQFVCHLPPALVAARPPRQNSAGPYHFHRLSWGDDIIREGEVMDNCLETYAGDLRFGNQVWSIRKGGLSLADVEIAFQDGARGMPRLVELLAKGNDPAPDDVWRATYRWLSRWRLAPTAVAVKEQPVRIDAIAWQRLWQPYWDAKPDSRAIPRVASEIGEHWFANQSGYLWELNRIAKNGN